MAANSGIFSSMYLRYIDLGIFLSLRSIYKRYKNWTGLTGLFGFLLSATFYLPAIASRSGEAGGDESGGTQSRPPGGKNLNIVNCRKNIFLNKIQFNSNYLFRRRRLNFLAFIRKAKNNIQ
jgi:hypothetical protein